MTTPSEQPAAAHIFVSTPCYACKMRKEFASSILQLQVEAIKQGIHISVDLLGNESLIPRARNVLTQRFLNCKDATHLLFIDADIAFDASTVFRLLRADKDIITAIYPKKHIDWDLVRTKKQRGDTESVQSAGLDYNLNILGRSAQVENGLVKVMDAATGFMMLKREAVQKLVDAFRSTLHCENDITSSRGDVPGYVAIWDCMIDPETKRYLSEDYAMCRRAQQIGLEIWADVMCPLAHIGSMNLEGDAMQRFALQYTA